MWLVEVTVTGEQAELLLCEDGLSGAEEEELPDGRLRLRLFFGSEQQAQAVAAREEGAIRWEADKPALGYQHDWKPLIVAERFFLRPPWVQATVPPGHIELIMQPGTIFGSGDHVTTELCLELLTEAVGAQDVVLDAGTGTGILAVAARQLGASRVYGFDSDGEAITLATRAAAEAGIRLHLWTGSWPSCRAGVVSGLCANLPGGLLLDALPSLLFLVRRPGWVILSGILEEHRSGIADQLTATSLTWRRHGEWLAVLARLA